MSITSILGTYKVKTDVDWEKDFGCTAEVGNKVLSAFVMDLLQEKKAKRLARLEKKTPEELAALKAKRDERRKASKTAEVDEKNQRTVEVNKEAAEVAKKAANSKAKPKLQIVKKTAKATSKK